MVGACWTRQATNYVQHDIRFCKVGFAFWHYAHEHGDRFPPAASRRPDGTPLLSWRVHLLPYIEQADLYKEFRLDEPWDSPHNLALLPRMPDDYRPLLARGAKPDPTGMTRCQVVVGLGTAFDGPAGLSPAADFPDGVSQTLLFIEARTPVPWTKPDDVRYDPAGPVPAFGPDTLCGLVFGASRLRRAMYMLADGGTGRVGRLDSAWDDGDLRRLIERNNGPPGHR